MSNAVAHKMEGGCKNPLLLSIMSLNAKIKRGEYELEEVSCFCGNKESVTVTKKDRYGIFYTMKLCPECGVMYASPRMTEDSAEKFYQKEYREIYEYGDEKQDEWDLGIGRAKLAKAVLDGHEVEPKVVFDIGCNMGQHLSMYDVECYGVDYSEENIEYGKAKGLNLIHGGIEELEKLDKKADLIILSHVFEHFIDLRKELDRIKDLLTDDGYLYIEVPGLYQWSNDILFQNAHNWQFNTKTLTYVMNSCGWEGMYADAQIKSIWRYTGIKNDDKALVKNQAKEIWDYKFGDEEKKVLPSIDPTCKFSLKERRENVRRTLSYKLKDISDIHEKELGRESIIIGGGPSVNGYIDEIREMQKEGKVVIAIERMYQWCQDNGIVPDYIMVMDAADDVIDSFERIDHNHTAHLLATQCNEEIFERLKYEHTFVYSSAQSNISFIDSWEENDYKKVTMLNTGSSVTLGCMSVSMFLGMKKLHIFGFDCHVTDSNYAKGITGVGDIKDVIEVDIDGKSFKTTVPYISFARQFFEMWKLGESINLIEDIRVYGDSLVKTMSKIDISGDKKGK